MMKRSWKLVVSVVLVSMLMTGFSRPAKADQAKVVCARDVWVSGVDDERNFSMSKTPKLKLKTIQEMALLDFDLASLKGKTTDGGWLYFKICVLEGDHAVATFNLPFERTHLLRRIGLSTVSTDWVEGQQAEEYKEDPQGATFLAASHGKKAWAFPGSDLTDVTMGNGHTFQCHGELEDLKDQEMWARIKVSPEIVRSLICRDGFGLMMMDELGQGLANNMIYSRDSKGNEPYLVVNVTGANSGAPGPTPQVTAKPAPAEAHMGKGALQIEIAGPARQGGAVASPAEAFCYFVKINGQDVPQWLVPHPKAGKAVVIVDTLKDGEDCAVEVVACDAAGNRSPAAKAQAKASPALAEPPKLPEGWKPKAGDVPARSGKLKVWAYPEVCKIKPTNGALFEAAAGVAEAADKTDSAIADEKELAYQKANSVWDGATNSIRVFGAKGEIVAFQLALQRLNKDEPLKDVSVVLNGLDGPGKIGSDQVKLFRLWYVRWPEYAVPMAKDEKLTIPPPDNALRVHNLQSVYVDIIVPKDAAAGTYKGNVEISAEGVEKFSLPITLEVYDFVVPDKMRFNPELNIYQSPGPQGSKTFFEAYRVAHYNRCTLSITQAGHNDNVKTPLPQEGAGANVKVKDWAQFDRSFGPLLDGSAFKDLPRAGVPLPTFQVPMSHGTPLGVNQHYSYTGQKNGKGTTFIHALLCKPLEEAYGEDFKKGFMSFARQIATHIEEKGWTETFFQFYMDGKPNYRETGGGTSYWTLDEPYNYDDWMAIKFFGSLWKKGIEGVPKRCRFGMRADISRPQWTRDWLYGIMTHQYVGGLMAKVKRCQIMAREGPLVNYSYGACNRPTDSNWGSAAWCISTYLAGADGVLPWQSLGSTTGQVNSMKQEDPNGLVVLDPLKGHNAVGSMRIMALRRGAQDVEYLITLGEKYGLNREQLKALVSGKIAAEGRQQQANPDDAAPVSFGQINPDNFAELREGLAKLIVAKK